MSMKVELFAPPYGDDLMVVNAARVSFDKRSEILTVGDTKLIRYLARGLTTDDWQNFVDDVHYSKYVLSGREELEALLWEWRRTPEHFAPFAHPHVSFRITAPIFVARQLAKHQVGMVWSEVSRRYVSAEPEFYTPEVWRKAAENVKQGSSDEAVDLDDLMDTKLHPDVIASRALESYNDMILFGVCPEQARMVLPQSMMTTWIWTGSLYGWANVFNKRKPGSHAQRECWPIAEQIASHMASFFPVSWEALTDVP
jgi:thymidylate synthase (FAD)